MFWSDWGSIPKIERATLAGEKRYTLVKSGLNRPLGLVMDFKQDRLYWVNSGVGGVESVDMYGHNRRLHFNVPGSNFFGITLYKVSSLVNIKHIHVPPGTYLI